MKKTVALIITAVVAAGLGFFIRGKMGPAGGPPAGMMGGRGPMPPATVMVKELKERPLEAIDEYIAMIEPVQQVMIRPEIDGKIDSVAFKEGDAVKNGDLLFAIESAPYRATESLREAELSQAQAGLVRAQKYYDRVKEADARSVSKADYDKAESDFLQAQAGLKQAQANLDRARIDVGYTEIRSPIAGRIGKALATKGNYVTTASTLAEIVQTDPIRAVFSLPDRVYLAMRQRELAGDGSQLAAKIRLPDGTLLPAVGKKDFDSNTMDANTGTMAVRYLFDNADGLMVPGGYAKILLENPAAPKGVAVPQKALLADQQGTYVLTVDADGKVAAVHVSTGAQIGQDLVVTAGLKAGDRVVVEGVQKAMPGATVKAVPAEEGQ